MVMCLWVAAGMRVRSEEGKWLQLRIQFPFMFIFLAIIDSQRK